MGSDRRDAIRPQCDPPRETRPRWAASRRSRSRNFRFDGGKSRGERRNDDEGVSSTETAARFLALDESVSCVLVFKDIYLPAYYHYLPIYRLTRNPFVISARRVGATARLLSLFTSAILAREARFATARFLSSYHFQGTNAHQGRRALNRVCT